MARRHALITFALAALNARAQSSQPNAGQPTKAGIPGTFEVVGDSGVSAQQLFLATSNKVIIIDKTENNPITVKNAAGIEHPAWSTEYDLNTNSLRPLEVVTNTFCAGGNVFGNGRWMNLGGNNAIGPGGIPLPDAQQNTGADPYYDKDGGMAVRFFDPCDNETCEWVDEAPNYITTRRWYPTLETLPDGRMLVMGGNKFGGYVSNSDNNNPTYEIYDPSKPNGGGSIIQLDLLVNSIPANLFPLTWLLPSGNMLVQSNWKTSILDWQGSQEHPIDDIKHAVRTYPASAATVILPLTPANNWTATIIFCGGSDLQPNQWDPNNNLAVYPASDSCVKITPDMSTSWVEDDSLPQGRIMGSFILQPDGKVWLGNGCNTGTAGYGNDTWVVGGHSYGDNPILAPLLYDPDAPAGSRFTSAGQSSAVARLYHSGATLLPDGSIFVSGSNPNPDFIPPGDGIYHTEYRVERWYPSYYSNRRPEPVGLPKTITYGGDYFDLQLSAQDLNNDPANAAKTKVVLIRTGFSTHALNMGQRLVQLDNTYTVSADGSAVLHVSQLPPNPNIIAPGPALIFVVVDGTPSVGVWVMIGSGKIEAQVAVAAATLPASSMPNGSSGGGSSGGGSSGGSGGGGGGGKSGVSPAAAIPPLAALATFTLVGILALTGAW